jgi:uncharacterized protein
VVQRESEARASLRPRRCVLVAASSSLRARRCVLVATSSSLRARRYILVAACSSLRARRCVLVATSSAVCQRGRGALQFRFHRAATSTTRARRQTRRAKNEAVVVDANILQAPREAQLSTLCQGCGFCCDGTLFTHVALEQAEARRLEGSPTQVAFRPRGGGAGAALVQHCGALEGCRCAVYAERPRGCRLFTCLLGRALLEGEVGLEEAQRQVEDTRARREALARLLPARPQLAPVLAEARRRAATTSGPLTLSRQAREALSSLERHLAFHFHRP